MLRVFGGNKLLSSNHLFDNTIKNTKILRRIVYISVIILLLLFLAFLSPIAFFSNNSDATAGTATASTLTFAFVNNKNTASVSLAVSSAEGNFAASTDNEKAEFRVSTNNATGYTLNLRTSNSTTALTSGTNTIASINAAKTSSNFTLNTYGLLPSKYNGTANTANYYPASSTGFKMDETSAANTTPNTYTVGLGIKASYATPAGAYTNTTLIAEYVANAVNYSITYDKGNATGTPTNMPSSQSGSISSTEITLSSTVPDLTGYAFLGWCFGTVTTTNNTDSCSGTVYNPNGNGTNLTFGIDQTTSMNSATLHAMWKMVLTINYNGNGLYYNNNPSQTVNSVKYDATSVQGKGTVTKYSHTANIDDAGTKSGSYSSDLATKDVVTISGSESLHLTITYGTENNWDMLYIFEGEYTGSISRNMDQSTTGWLYKYMGGSNTTTTVEIDVPGDTVTFGFYSDGTGNYWGYYAVVEGIGDVIINDKVLVSGTYAAPSSTVGPFRFLGWSENANATTPTYLNESEVITNNSYVNADGSVTLYAIYQRGLTIKFNANGGSGTMGDQVIYAGETEPLTANAFTGPTATPYFKEWNTASGGTGTRMVNGSSYTAPSNIALGATQTLYAIWLPLSTITFKTVNATSIVFNGVTYTNNQTVVVEPGSYHIYGNYATKYAFSSWSATLGDFGNSSFQDTNYTISGDATITLTGQSVTLAMQNLSSANCTSTARPVYDNRDNSVYWIKRLADNKCWMLDNLAFDPEANLSTITTSNTNISTAGLNAITNGGSEPYSRKTISSTWTLNTYTDALIFTEDKNKTLMPEGSVEYTNSIVGAYGAGQNKVGIYYNYCAATGGTFCYNDFTTNNASYDICPAGWRLPTGGNTSSSEYQVLCDTLLGSTCSTTSTSQPMRATDSNSIQYQLSVALTGEFRVSMDRQQGSNGYFYTSTRQSQASPYIPMFKSDSVHYYSGSLRDGGYSVRCVLN